MTASQKSPGAQTSTPDLNKVGNGEKRGRRKQLFKPPTKKRIIIDDENDSVKSFEEFFTDAECLNEDLEESSSENGPEDGEIEAKKPKNRER